MVLQGQAQVDQFPVDLGHILAELMNGLGSADPGYHVFTLGVDQVFPIDTILAGSGVAGETHTGGAGLAHVAEDHGNDVDRRAVGHLRGDVEFAPVVDGPLSHPGAEDGLHGQFQLPVDVGGKILAGFFLDQGLEVFAEDLQVLDLQFCVQLYPAFSLQRCMMESKWLSSTPKAIFP